MLSNILLYITDTCLPLIHLRMDVCDDEAISVVEYSHDILGGSLLAFMW